LRGNGKHDLRPAPQDLTVATLLKRAGYRTAMVGKSCFTGNTQNPQRVLDKGFDVFYGTTSHKDGHFRYPRFIYPGKKTKAHYRAIVEAMDGYVGRVMAALRENGVAALLKILESSHVQSPIFPNKSLDR